MAEITGNIACSAKAAMTTLLGPKNLANLVSWWKADRASSLHLTGSSVNTWDDQLGTNNLTGGGSQPTNVDTVNSKVALAFNGVATTIAKTFTQAQPLTIWCVQKGKATGTRRDIMSGNAGNAMSTKIAGADTYQMYAGSVVDSGITEDTSVHLLIYVYNGASSVVYVDGTAGTTVNPGTNSITAFSWGPQGSGFSANMSLCEGGLHSGAMSSGDRATLRTYCQATWGTP